MTDDSFIHLIRGAASDEYRELTAEGVDEMLTVSSEALLDADTFEDMSGKWQAAILEVGRNRPKLRIVSDA